MFVVLRRLFGLKGGGGGVKNEAEGGLLFLGLGSIRPGGQMIRDSKLITFFFFFTNFILT